MVFFLVSRVILVNFIQSTKIPNHFSFSQEC